MKILIITLIIMEAEITLIAINCKLMTYNKSCIFLTIFSKFLREESEKQLEYEFLFIF